MASQTVGGDKPHDVTPAHGVADVAMALALALAKQNYTIVDAALPLPLFRQLQQRAQQQTYRAAQIGRAQPKVALATRSDEIAWVNSTNTADVTWMRWLDTIQQGLNRQLFLGLRSAESHYAHYAPGTRYRRHRDAFANRHTGSSSDQASVPNRVVSLVLYLNQDWPLAAQGELVLYSADAQQVHARVLPKPNRLVAFMSADTPHEVLPALQDRYSLAAWFRS